VQAVLNLVHTQHTNLLEGPSRQAAGKLPVVWADLLGANLLDLGVEPLVLQHLGRAHDGHTRRVARLEHRDQGQLLTNGKQVLRVDSVGLLLGVVAVGGAGGAQDGGQELALAEHVAHGVRDGQVGAGHLKVLLAAVADVDRGVEHEDIVLLGGGHGVIVEVVHDGAGALGGQGDFELGQERDERAGDGCRRGLGQEDVALGVNEVDQDVRGQVGTKA
jgi:hypothetical protein